MRPLFFVSDYHLGDGSGSEDFDRLLEFMDLVDVIDRRGGVLVVLGDFYELWQARLEKIMWYHRRLLQTMADLEAEGRVVYVFGNHDYLPFRKYWLEFFEDHQLNLVAYHGHQHDEANKFGNPLKALRWPIGRYVTVLVAGLEKYIHPDADDWALRMEKKFGKFLWDAAKIQNLKRNEHPYEHKDFPLKQHRIHIMGHTHDAKLIELPSGLIYGNCGAWVSHKTPTYILVEKYLETCERIISLREAKTHRIINEIRLGATDE